MRARVMRYFLSTQLEVANVDGWYDTDHSNSLNAVGYQDQKTYRKVIYRNCSKPSKNQTCGNGVLTCLFASVGLGEGYQTGVSALRTPGYCGCSSYRWAEAKRSKQLWRPQALGRTGRVGAWCCRGTAGAWQAALDGIQTLGGQGWWYSEKGIPWDVWIKSREGKGTWRGEAWTRCETTFSSSKRKNALERFAGLDLLSWTKRIVRRDSNVKHQVLGDFLLQWRKT